MGLILVPNCCSRASDHFYVLRIELRGSDEELGPLHGLEGGSATDTGDAPRLEVLTSKDRRGVG